MTRAYELGRWASRNKRTLVGTLALLLVVVIVVLVSKSRTPDTPAVPAAVVPSWPSQEDVEKAAAERAEAERQREAQRQRELEAQLQAMERLKRAILEKSRADVKACASVVRERTDARLKMKGFSTFDAYVTGEYGEDVSFFGTAEERFQFEKCMADRGTPLSKQKAEDREK